jgi:hypothetical protein
MIDTGRQPKQFLAMIVVALILAVSVVSGASSSSSWTESLTNMMTGGGGGDNEQQQPTASDESGGECVLALRVLAFNKEIEHGELHFSDAGVSTFRYNLYDVDDSIEAVVRRREQPTPVGVYIGASHTVHGDDCVGTGSFNFDYNVETDSYDSQIYVSVSCSGTYNAITGGTGRYAYIKNGHEVIVDGPRELEGEVGTTVSELHFTSETCTESPQPIRRKTDQPEEQQEETSS